MLLSLEALPHLVQVEQAEDEINETEKDEQIRNVSGEKRRADCGRNTYINIIVDGCRKIAQHDNKKKRKADIKINLLLNDHVLLLFACFALLLQKLFLLAHDFSTMRTFREKLPDRQQQEESFLIGRTDHVPFFTMLYFFNHVRGVRPAADKCRARP